MYKTKDEIKKDWNDIIGGTIIETSDKYSCYVKIKLKDGRIAHLTGEGDDMAHICLDIDDKCIKQIKLKDSIMKITCCGKCPCTDRNSIGAFCYIKDEYVNLNDIPEWCPLEDVE